MPNSQQFALTFRIIALSWAEDQRSPFTRDTIAYRSDWYAFDLGWNSIQIFANSTEFGLFVYLFTIISREFDSQKKFHRIVDVIQSGDSKFNDRLLASDVRHELLLNRRSFTHTNTNKGLYSTASHRMLFNWKTLQFVRIRFLYILFLRWK